NLAAEPSLGHALAEAAGAGKLLDLARRVGGDLDQRLVAQYAAALQVALLRRRLAPRGERAQHAEKFRIGAGAQPKTPPRLGRLAAVERRVGERRHLLGEPAGAAVLGETLLQPFIDRAQMDDVVERVANL